MQTLELMARLARDGSQDFNIRELALTICDHAPQKDYRREACRLLAFVRDRIRYVRDTASAEVLQGPQATLALNAGDCDDKCILLAALLASIGHTPRFITMAQLPERYTHVWTQCLVGDNWLDLEPTEPIGCGRRVPDTGTETYLTRELDP